MFAAANTKLPDQLYAEGLVEKPVELRREPARGRGPANGSDGVFVRRPRQRRASRSRPGPPSVPVGSYTREVLAQLRPQQAQAIEDNIRSNEPDVAGVVGKVAAGRGRRRASSTSRMSRRRAVGSRRSTCPPAAAAVVYGAAVVRATKRPSEARAFVEGLLRRRRDAGAREAGFEPPAP